VNTVTDLGSIWWGENCTGMVESIWSCWSASKGSSIPTSVGTWM